MRAISEPTVFAILELLAGGYSQRDAAQLAGVSRAAITVLLRDRQAIVERVSEQRRPELQRLLGAVAAREADRGLGEGCDEPPTWPERCPCCGRLVWMPCVLCATHAAGDVPRATECLVPPAADDPDPVMIEERKPPKRFEPMGRRGPDDVGAIRQYWPTDYGLD